MVNWVILSNLENDVTQSRLYIHMMKQTQTNQDQKQDPRKDQQHDQDSQPLLRKVLGNALHVVAIGQAYGYPINEHIRTHVLGGISYGYHPSDIAKEEENATIDIKKKGANMNQQGLSKLRFACIALSCSMFLSANVLADCRGIVLHAHRGDPNLTEFQPRD